MPSASNAADDHFATGYISTTPPVVAQSIPMNAFAPAEQLAASATDMARFIALHLGDDLANNGRILHNSALREMHAPVLLEPDWQGWDCDRLVPAAHF
jgi:CubicO group peptidase (beta-lactamase class C family)